MLKAAQLYEDQLNRKIIESWYDQSNRFWNGNEGCSIVELPEDCIENHNFVSVDENDNVIGYISYSVHWDVMSAEDFGIINFDKGNIQFGRDLKKVVINLFEEYNMNRISWYCHADNPVIKAYRNFVRLNGGTECGYFHEFTKLSDGLLHDSVMFEIMSKDYYSAKEERIIRISERKLKEQDERIKNLLKGSRRKQF